MRGLLGTVGGTVTVSCSTLEGRLNVEYGLTPGFYIVQHILIVKPDESHLTARSRAHVVSRNGDHAVHG